MLCDQPADEVDVLGREPVRAAEAACLGGTQRRVVAAAALRDVVEQTGEVEHFLALEIADQPRAQRILVPVLRFGEAAQVADDHQAVLVHGVDVEEVVLHLADDPAERRDDLPEDAVEVHPAQLVRDAARLAQDRQESRPVRRVAPETGVDAATVAP